LEEGSRWFRASDTTGLLSHNVDPPEGLKKRRECSEKKTSAGIPPGCGFFGLRDPVVR
jgi:hypothetical protein